MIALSHLGQRAGARASHRTQVTFAPAGSVRVVRRAQERERGPALPSDLARATFSSVPVR
jgi:hypothetical protein